MTSKISSRGYLPRLTICRPSVFGDRNSIRQYQLGVFFVGGFLVLATAMVLPDVSENSTGFGRRLLVGECELTHLVFLFFGIILGIRTRGE